MERERDYHAHNNYYAHQEKKGWEGPGYEAIVSGGLHRSLASTETCTVHVMYTCTYYQLSAGRYLPCSILRYLPRSLRSSLHV